MKKITIYLLLNICFLIQNNAQFKLLTDSLKGLRNGELTCTDFDSDGDLDILTFGDDTLARSIHYFIGMMNYFLMNSMLMFSLIYMMGLLIGQTIIIMDGWT